MTRLRSYYDADRENNSSIPTDYRTADNQNELYCGMCGETFFVDDYLFENVNKVIEETLENSFLCQNCLDEYEELSHPH